MISSSIPRYTNYLAIIFKFAYTQSIWCVFSFHLNILGTQFTRFLDVISVFILFSEKLSRASLVSDEAPTEYRRKSAGSPNASAINSQGFGSVGNTAEPYIYAFDECERHPDGTVVLR